MSERLIKTPIRYYFDNIMDRVKRREYDFKIGRNIMNVFFYTNKDSKDSILQYEVCPYNNIPRIGEKVIIKNKWYLVENIENKYKELTNFTFTDVYIYLKELED